MLLYRELYLYLFLSYRPAQHPAPSYLFHFIAECLNRLRRLVAVVRCNFIAEEVASHLKVVGFRLEDLDVFHHSLALLLQVFHLTVQLRSRRFESGLKMRVRACELARLLQCEGCRLSLDTFQLK